MVKVILILWITAGSGAAHREGHIATVEYRSPQDCLYALENVKKNAVNINGVCTVK